MNKTKISNAGDRMLEVLKALSQKPLCTQEILEYLEETIDINYRKEIILKYINTMKLLNIDITKVQGKYTLRKSLECIDFSKRDLSVLEFIKKYIEKINQDNLKDNILETLQIIEQNFSENTLELINNTHIRTYRPLKPLQIKDKNIEQFEKFCRDELKLEITYKNENSAQNNTYIIAPLHLIYKKGIAILIAYCSQSNEYKEFLLNNISEIKQLPQKHIQGVAPTVLFKLKNRLAKSYILKKGETVLEMGKDYLIVSNKGEDKELLTRRLMRYYDQCEILYPKTFRKNFVDIIDAMEKLYE